MPLYGILDQAVLFRFYSLYADQMPKASARHRIALKIKLCFCLFPFEGKKRDKSCSLDCGREKSLVLRAYARHTARKDFTFLGYVFFQFGDVFIIDFGSFFQAKSANLSSRRFSHRLFGSYRSSGSCRGRCRYVCSLFFHDFNSF